MQSPATGAALSPGLSLDRASAGRMTVVSDRLNWRVSAIIRRSSSPRASSTTHSGLPPNADGVRWFAREVWPLVVERIPEAVLTLIGKDPPADLRDGANLPGRTDITGYVADPTLYLKETAVFIVPLRAGGGMRVKILDAWRWGLPVCSTAMCAEGIYYNDGEDLIIADDAAEFAAAVARVWSDPALARQLAAGGRATISRAYDWRSVYRQWDGIYS